jgi:hypothetical protein
MPNDVLMRAADNGAARSSRHTPMCPANQQLIDALVASLAAESQQDNPRVVKALRMVRFLLRAFLAYALFLCLT